jgi:hypothetical protein
MEQSFSRKNVSLVEIFPKIPVIRRFITPQKGSFSLLRVRTIKFATPTLFFQYVFNIILPTIPVTFSS